MRRRKKPVWIWVAGGVAVVAVVAALIFVAARPSEPTIRFFGQVVDEAGRPIAGARVEVSTFEIKPGLMATELQRVVTSEERMAMDTDANGRFTVVSDGGYELHVRDISKAGYDWVYDWAWTRRRPGTEQRENRVYRFSSPYARANVYESDPDRPAIFPMHKRGSLRAVGKPSRGGWEIGAGGVRTANGPVEVSIPSAGPDAPRTPEEIEKRILDLGVGD